ncbi:MAG: oxidoreductase, partial [Thermoanaerobaculia bacterium]
MTMNLEALRAAVRGQVITAEDSRYETARKVYNGMIDRRPQVIVQAGTTADVMAAVDYSRENGLELSVRGGSH